MNILITRLYTKKVVGYSSIEKSSDRNHTVKNFVKTFLSYRKTSRSKSPSVQQRLVISKCALHML